MTIDREWQCGYGYMNSSLEHLPQHKQAELALVVETIRQKVDQLEMIILFGSYARGNWVEDKYVEDGNTYEYKSDFDILAVTATESAAQTTGLWRKVKTAIRQKSLDTPVTLIVHDIGFLNRKIQNFIQVLLQFEYKRWYDVGRVGEI